MIVDSPALLAVLFREHDADTFAETMVEAERLQMSVASWFEAAMAVDGFAKATGEPLLFKGNDFAQTDIESALKG